MLIDIIQKKKKKLRLVVALQTLVVMRFTIASHLHRLAYPQISLIWEVTYLPIVTPLHQSVFQVQSQTLVVMRFPIVIPLHQSVFQVRLQALVIMYFITANRLNL